jgi:hypothetical protein
VSLEGDRRQEQGARAAVALGFVSRNARGHDRQSHVFSQALDRLQSAIVSSIEDDGRFELVFREDGATLNGHPIVLKAGESLLVGDARARLLERGARGISARVAPPRTDLRELVRLLSEGAPAGAGPRGDRDRRLAVLRLLTGAKDLSSALVSAYAHAVYFVDHTIRQLRLAGELIPLQSASRVVQDLVDLQAMAPRQFLQLARAKAGKAEYWGHHAANVAVLSISFAARLGLAKARKHDLGMAALFHDVGTAAIPPALLERTGKLDARARGALEASPLFAARAILRDREVHTAALERALAVYECHLDLIPAEGPPPDIGLAGRILAICESYDALTTDRPFRPAHPHGAALRVMTTEQLFRFDPRLVDLFPAVVEPLVRP